MSKTILGMYKEAGLKPPKGKGIHTKKFHEVVIGLMKKNEVDNPHAVAMTILGRKKAVKKSHRR